MKHLLLILLLTTPILTLAQDSSTKKHEFGVNIYSLTDYKDVNYFFYYVEGINRFVGNWMTGVQYKRNWSKSSLRVSLDYNYKYREISGAHAADGIYYIGYEEYEGTISFFRIENRIGYQRHFGNGKLHPFVAIDIIQGYDSKEQTERGVDYLNPDGTQKFYRRTYNAYRYGIGMSLGAQYYFSPIISCSIEASVNSMGEFYSENKSSSDYAYSISGFKGVKLEFNPIRLLSVNYHF